MSATQLSMYTLFERSVRRTDPDTSRSAARGISDAQRERVRQYLLSVPDATDYEIAMSLGILRTSAGKRRKELGAVDTGSRRKTDTGVGAIVWRLGR